MAGSALARPSDACHAWHIREQDPSRNVVYLSAEKFMYRFVQALSYRDTMSFKEQFRSVDVLMIDDVQFISGKDSTQENSSTPSTRLLRMAGGDYLGRQVADGSRGNGGAPRSD